MVVVDGERRSYVATLALTVGGVVPKSGRKRVVTTLLHTTTRKWADGHCISGHCHCNYWRLEAGALPLAVQGCSRHCSGR